MSDPYGGPFAAWDPGATYYQGDRVSYGGYVYVLMSASSTNHDPRTATYTATLTDRISPDSATATFRRWTIWDYPAGHYYARLRGLPAFELDGIPQARTFCVRGEFDNRTESYTYPTSASFEGYGMPAGLDCNWPDPSEGSLMTMPSEVPYEDYGQGLVPKKYPYQPSIGGDEAVCFQPNTVSAEITQVEFSGDFYDTLIPAWTTETQGQMFACMATFSRTYDFKYGGTSTDSYATDYFGDGFLTPTGFTPYDDIDFIIGTDAGQDFYSV